MINVSFPGPIGVGDMVVEAANLRDLREKLSANSSIKPWLKTCSVLVNDEIASDLDMSLRSGDRVVILAPVCGG